MNFEAIQHIPMSQQAHGIDPNHVVFRLRAGRDDLKHCTLFYADRACRLTPVIFSSVEMQVDAQDEWFDYFQVILESPYKRICYYFELAAGKSISTLTLLEIPEFGNVDCTVTITAFRDGKQIGSMRTELVLHTAYRWPKEVQ